MAKQLQVVELGNPMLRQVAQPIANIHHDRIQKLSRDLLLTVKQTNGVGIAAPQVGHSDRLFVVASRPNLRYPHAPIMEPTVMINPQILSHSTEVVQGWEGCLSVPGIRGLVPRYQAIAVEYTGLEGRLYQQEFADFIARIFQHELDHLDGLVFLDRVKSTQDLMTEQEYMRRVV